MRRHPYDFTPSVNLAPDGKEALLKLSKGDMRRALNILQACHAAYDVVDETAVYNCTGNPHPKDVEAVVQSMMRDEFSTSYECKSSFGEGYAGEAKQAY
jgi:replication factor C subunit 3/5